MEHTMLASYVGLLIGYLVIENADHEDIVRKYLRNGSFQLMVQILEKYYNFMNLTASVSILPFVDLIQYFNSHYSIKFQSEAIQVAHIKETKRIIQYLKDCDSHSNDEVNQQSATISQTNQTYSTRQTTNSNNETNRNTYGITRGSTSSTNNAAFNDLYFSGR